MNPRNVLNDPWKTAITCVELLRRVNKSTLRISDKSLRAVSGRKRLEGTFREQVRIFAADYGVLFIKLEGTGKSGTLLIDLEQVSKARVALFKDYFSEAERTQITDGTFDFDALYASLKMPPDDDENEDPWA